MLLGEKYASAVWRLRRHWAGIAAPWFVVGVLFGSLSVLWAFSGYVPVPTP